MAWKNGEPTCELKIHLSQSASSEALFLSLDTFSVFSFCMMGADGVFEAGVRNREKDSFACGQNACGYNGVVGVEFPGGKEHWNDSGRIASWD
jgi:hypothetical protein